MTDLGTFRDAVLAGAREEAAACLEEADADVAAWLEEAEADAAAVVDRARRRGREAARHVMRQHVAEARQQAREQVLRARRTVLDEVHDEAVARLRDRHGGAGYRRLCDRLAEAARQQLGDGVVVDEDEDVGGVVAHVAGRSVDYRLPVLVDRVLEDMAGELEELWR